MRSIDDYSDDELQRLLAKCEGVQGAKDRVAAIQSALNSRGLDSGRLTVLQQLQANNSAHS